MCCASNITFYDCLLISVCLVAVTCVKTALFTHLLTYITNHLYSVGQKMHRLFLQ